MKNVSAAVVLVAVTLLGMLWQKQSLGTSVALEMAVIFALALSGLVLVFATASGAHWAAGLGVLFFAASILNSTLIYFIIREAFLEYLFLLGWTTLGLIYCATRTNSENVQPYGEAMQLENIMPAPKSKAAKVPAKKVVRRTVRKARKPSRRKR